VGAIIRRVAKRAGLTIHTHTLRHKFATDLLERGANIRQVQALMGHSNLSATQVYLSITDQGLKDTVDLLDQPQQHQQQYQGWIPDLKPLPIVPIDLRRNKNAIPPYTDKPKPKRD